MGKLNMANLDKNLVNFWEAPLLKIMWSLCNPCFFNAEWLIYGKKKNTIAKWQKFVEKKRKKKIGNRKKKYSTCCVPINDLFSNFVM
jgi:hypothetical protein